MDKTELVIQTYNATAHNYTRKFWDFDLYNDAFDRFLDLLVPGAGLLDIACGPGNVASYMLTRLPSLKITGVDLSEAMIEIARTKVPGAEFLVRDIRRLEFATGSFDAALASFCLPYLYHEEALAFLKQLATIIRPGGHVYLSTMKGEGQKITDASFTEGKELFFNYYSEEFLEGAFREIGFTVVESFKKDYPEPDGSVTVDLIYILRNGRSS